MMAEAPFLLICMVNGQELLMEAPRSRDGIFDAAKGSESARRIVASMGDEVESWKWLTEEESRVWRFKFQLNWVEVHDWWRFEPMYYLRYQN